MKGKRSTLQIEQKRLEEAKIISNKKWDAYLERIKTEKIDREELVRIMIDVNQVDYKILRLVRRDLLG